MRSTGRASLKDLTIRDLVTNDEREQCVALQEATWGAGFRERVPSAILQVGPKIGGVTAGAFDASGRLVGFVFGLTGIRNDTRVHWSDMLAVVPELRGVGLGERLKQYQRAQCEAMGVHTMYWTWDPLVARNTHLNLNKLGARVDEFVENMYGVTDSPLMGALPTDRFIAAWELSDKAMAAQRALRAADAPHLSNAPLVAAGPEHPVPIAWPDADAVRVRIPHDFVTLLQHDPLAAAAYRRHSHAAFMHYFARRYYVSSFHPGSGGESTYLLKRGLA